MSDGHGSSWQHLRTGLVVVVLSAACSFYLHGTAAMRAYEELDFDAWTKGLEESSGDLYLIVVDDRSFIEDFDARSPLDQKTIQTLIETAVQRGAAVVGVDLDTRDWDPALLSTLPASVLQRVVWARLPLGKARQSRAERRAQDEALRRLHTCSGSVVFGNTDVGHPEHANVTGIVRTMPVASSIDGRLHAPLGDVIASVAKAGHKACAQSGTADAHAEYIRFLTRDAKGLPSVSIISAHDLLSSTTGEFHGGIVLIGGTFEESGDLVITPFGLQPGVSLHADVVYTRLQGNPYRAWTAVDYLWLDLVLGTAVVLWGLLTRHRSGVFWAGLIGVALASVLFSLGVFHAAAQYLSVWPVLLGVGVHEVLEHLAPGYWKRVLRDLRRIRIRRPNLNPDR